MNKKENKFLNGLIKKYNKSKDKKFYSLVGEPFTSDDIIAGIKTLLSGRITMSSITKKFEENFAKFIGSKYALMVNSGSSANLLAFFSFLNLKIYFTIKKSITKSKNKISKYRGKITKSTENANLPRIPIKPRDSY